MTRAAIYTRVSTEMQVEGWSLADQVKACRKFCHDKGWQIANEYEERGESASTTKRTEFQRMMADARAGGFNVIVTHKLDRLSRSITDIMLIMHELSRLNVQYASVAEQFDFTSPVGRIILAVLAALAEWYLANLRTEIHRGKRERAASGHLNASIAPFGYTLQGGWGERADDARWIFSAYRSGSTYRDIAAELNRRGIRTSRNNPFSQDAVREIIQNPYYAGWVRERGMTDEVTASGTRRRVPRHKATLHRGAHLPLITQEEYDECQAIRARKWSTQRERAPRRVERYLLAGILYCSHCGRLMRAGSWADGRYRNYMCRSTYDGHECNATHRYVPESALMPRIDELMKQVQLSDEIKARAVELANAQPDPAPDKSKLESERKRLTRMYQRGDVDEAYYDREIERIKRALAAVPVQADIPRAITELAEFSALWGAATLAEKALIAHNIIERVECDPDERRITRVVPRAEYAPLLRLAW